MGTGPYILMQRGSALALLCSLENNGLLDAQASAQSCFHWTPRALKTFHSLTPSLVIKLSDPSLQFGVDASNLRIVSIEMVLEEWRLFLCFQATRRLSIHYLQRGATHLRLGVST